MKRQHQRINSLKDLISFRLGAMLVAFIILMPSSAHAGRGAYLYFVNHTDDPMSFKCTGSREGLTDNSGMCKKVDGEVSGRGDFCSSSSANRIYIEESSWSSVTYMKIRVRAGSFDNTVKIYAKNGMWHVGSIKDPQKLTASIERNSQDEITFELGTNSRWMSLLPDKSIPLNQLLLMGTHDSATAKYARAVGFGPKKLTIPYVVTQSMSIEDQLKFGIRFLDLRFGCLDRSCSKVSLVHGSFQLFHHMVPTLDGIIKFLEENPSEAVMVSMKIDDDSHSSGGLKIASKISKYISNNKSYFFDAGSGLKPSFSDVQGKIYIVDRIDNSFNGNPEVRELSRVGAGLSMEGDVSYGVDGTFRYQDRYQNPDYEDKINAVRDFGKEYMNGNNFNDYFNLNFMSAAGADGSTVKDYASRVNRGYFSRATFGTRHAGVYIMDFPKIYSGAPDGESYFAIIDRLINRSLLNSKIYSGGSSACP